MTAPFGGTSASTAQAATKAAGKHAADPLRGFLDVLVLPRLLRADHA